MLLLHRNGLGWTLNHDGFLICRRLLIPFLSMMFSLQPAVPRANLVSQFARQAAGEKKQAVDDVRVLKQSEPVEREIRGGEIHHYRINLALGQYMQMIVDQRRIDLVISLSGPDKRVLIEVDTPDRQIGSEHVYFVAEATGSYRPTHN